MRTIGFTLAATAVALALGCSGRYEVGGMDVSSSAPSGAGTAGGPSRGDDMAMMVMGLGGSGSAVNPTASTGDLGATCVPAGMPEPLEGPFAEPQLVWDRMSPWFAGESEPPSPLPETTTYVWARGLASEAHAVWGDPTLGNGSIFLTRLIQGEGLGLDEGAAAQFLAPGEPLLARLLVSELDEGRLGIFSQQPWLAAYPAISTRGMLMVQALFNQQVPPEPQGLDSDLMPVPDMTRREQLTQTVAAPNCAACHKFVDPLGLSLEHFGADGELRTLDQARPIDSSGDYLLPTSGKLIHFDDNVSLGKQLVDTCDANLGIAGRFVRIALELDGRPEAEREAAYQASVERVQQAFIRGGRTYRALLDAYLDSPAVLEP